MLLILLAAAALINLSLVQRSTVQAFQQHDADALRADVDHLRGFGIVNAGVTALAEGDTLLLEGKLTDAESRFDDAVQHTDLDESCPARINLELVRETLADLPVSNGAPDDAQRLYDAAAGTVQQAPPGCFTGSIDPNADRRAVLNDAEASLQRKLAAMRQPPPPPPTTATVTPEPPPAPGSSGPVNPAPPALPPIGPTDPNQPPPPGVPPIQLPALPGANLPAPPPAPAPPPPPPQPAQPGPGDLRVANPAEPNAPRILGPVGADGLPLGDPNAAAPDLTLSPGEGDPLDRLQDLLANANSFGGERQ